jgi:GntR family transcriptional regulator, transcriptional repressor for pyruvate dehydrogenase complex
MAEVQLRDAVQPGRSLVDRAHGEIRRRILAGRLGPEDRLPTEHEFARDLDVSRPTVRLALGRLRDEGLIYSRRGAGSFVRALPGTEPPARHDALAFAPVETIADIQRCFEFRLTIEPDAAFHAASRRGAEELAALGAAVDGLAVATAKRLHREDLDFAFHRAVARASNNHYYATALEALQGHVAVGMKLHGLSLMSDGGRLDGVLAEHRTVFAAVRDGAPDAAKLAMRAHLRHSRDRLFEGRLLDLSLDGGRE